MKRLIILIISGLLLYSCGRTRGTKGLVAPDYQVEPRRAEVLFLGHDSEHHNSYRYADWLSKAVFNSGINITYTEKPGDLNTPNLEKFDGVVIYANHDYISPSQEKALKKFVEEGNGLIPIHSAAGNFKNSDWYVNTIGGQFKSHGEGTFSAEIVNPTHPVMAGISEFETWDETYLHQRVNPDMTVLMERVEGDIREPYTWVREQGEGRVFYTAYGHNDSTWKSYDYLQLLENGILWAVGDDVRESIAKLDIPDVNIYDTMNIADYTERHFVPRIQEDLSPEESQKLIQVPVDFEIELFAAEPDVVNPIAMSWDERGRLWVVESVDYPNTFVETDGEANDRIKILEDTDEDGKADKFTVFADSLNIPTSIAFANGGVIVSMAPDFLFLKDTDGDDKADVEEVIMTGWGKNDTHAGPSNLLYGFDNKIWGVTGYSGFNGTINGEERRFGQGVYNLNPDGTDFEFLGTTSNNTWGLGISEDNNVFISTANNTHSAYYSIPARFLQRYLPEPEEGSDVSQFEIQPVQKIDGHYVAHHVTPNSRQVDVVSGFTAAAGHHLYTARSFPKEYWNRIAFVNEPTVRLLHRAVIEPDGAGFKELDGWNMMASTDEWFGPVDAKVGPDGALWVADWYNFIIQHNVFVERQAPSRVILPFEEQPHGQGNAFKSPLRDTNHGRIYRVVYKDAEPYEPISLSEDDTEGLLAALEHDNMFWRMTAQRLLVESQDKEALPGLYALISNRSVDEIGLNGPALHALWTLHGLEALEGDNEEALRVVTRALTHPAAGVRKAAAQVLPKNEQTAHAIIESGIIDDKNLNVRMNALLVAASLPPTDGLGKAVYEASRSMENVEDGWISKALFAAAVAQEEPFLTAVENDSVRAGEFRGSDFTKRLVEGVRNEVYQLRRRGTLQYPTDVVGKGIEINASLRKRGDTELEGVILAHGDQENGYALFMKDGKVHWVINQGGLTYSAVSTDRLVDSGVDLGDGIHLVAHLEENGEMSVVADGTTIAKGKAPSTFLEPLVGTVYSGEDAEDPDNVGEYEGSYPFVDGGIRNISLSLQ